MWISFVDSPWSTLFFPLTLGLCVLLGARYAHHLYVLRQRTWQATGMEGGIISMYGLLLSFTLAASGDAVRTRDAIVHEEAAQVRALHRQSQQYPAALRRPVHRYLRGWLTHQLAHPTPSPGQCQALLRALTWRTRQLDHALRRYAAPPAADRAAVQQVQATSVALNATSRNLLYSFRERTPSVIIIGLILFSWVVSFMIGFMNRFQVHSSHVLPWVYVITATVLMTTIRDLDDPSRGIVTPDYQDLTLALQELQSAP